MRPSSEVVHRAPRARLAGSLEDDGVAGGNLPGDRGRAGHGLVARSTVKSSGVKPPATEGRDKLRDATAAEVMQRLIGYLRIGRPSLTRTNAHADQPDMRGEGHRSTAALESTYRG